MKRSCALLLCLAATGAAQAAEGNWRIRGDTTLRLDRYEQQGNAGLAPYRHTGNHAYQDFNLQLSGRPREQEYWEFNVSGVFSDSDYRTSERGFRPEWLHLRHENNHAGIPFRIDLGDQYAQFSKLTLDRRMQGARVELQPISEGERRHSVVWVSGRESTDWEDPSGTEDTYHGVSWLVEDEQLGRYSVNVVRVSPGGGSSNAVPEDTQLVASVAAAWEMAVYRQQLEAEAEWSWLDGEAVADGPDSDQGVRVKMSGSDQALPLNYAFHYERYGRGFKPAGVNPGLAHNMADSRKVGGSSGWRFNSGLEVQGSFNRYVDDVSQQPTTVDDWNVRVLSPGSFGWASWMDQEWSVRVRDRENDLGTVDTMSTEARWNVRMRNGDNASTQFQFRWLALDNHLNNAYSARERQFSASHTRRFQLGPVNLSLTPGVDVRERTGTGEVLLVSPTLNLNAGSHGHNVGLHLGYRAFDRPDGVDLEEYNLKLDYGYHVRTHTFGVEYDRLLREPEVGGDAEAWRIGMYWRYNFDHALGKNH